MTAIGFIGLGQMGGFMAKNLIRKGKSVIVHDMVNANVASLVKFGATSASSTSEVAQQCNTIVTMLPSTPHVSQVYEGKKGLLENANPGTLFIDSSTIDPLASKALGESIELFKSHMVDAPVSGGVIGAEAGTLTFMVGGNDVSYTMAKPILELMGKNIVHCGHSSMGQVAKLCNNLALAIEMIGVSEALNLGTKLGMDPKMLSNIMNTSSSQCWSSSAYNPYPGVMENVPAGNDYNGGFASALMRKDLGLALDAAKSCETSVPLTASAHQIYNMVCNAGRGSKDFGYVLKFLNGETKQKH